MATISWTGLGSTPFHFNNPNNWQGTVIPGSGDDVVILPAAATTIDSTDSRTINSLALKANVTLTIDAGTTFTVNDGTNGAGIAGQLLVANNAVLSIGGAIVNSGTIGEQSTGTTTKILLNQTTNTLTGGGKVILSANTSNQIQGNSTNFELDNVDNTISGGGNIGNGTMVLSNEGIINANEPSAALTVNTGGNVILNSGIMEATGGGDLNILSVVNNVGGTIEAIGAGSTVTLQANVSGGLVTASAGGVVQTGGGFGVLDGLALHPVTVGFPVQVLNSSALTLLGSIINNSSINLNANTNNTDLRIGSAFVTLTGTGAIHLTNNSNNRIFGNNGSFQLINQTNTIDGAGQLGASQLTLINKKLIDANQPTALVLNTSGQQVINTGTMQSTNTGGLLIQNTSINNSGGGVIQATATGSHVDLAGSGIAGGTLKTSNGGVIQTVSGNGSLDGLTYGQLTNTGTVVVNDQTQLTLFGVINNTGTINVDQVSGSGSTQLRMGGQKVTLTGGGKVILSDNTLNLVFGNSGNTQLVNVNNKFTGAGNIGDGQLTLINQAAGVINADQAGSLLAPGQLTFNASNSVTQNQGTFESTNTGGLLLLNDTINNSGGTILANGAATGGLGAFVNLSGTTIRGGNLVTSNGGTIATVSGNGGLDGITNGAVANKGLFWVTSQTELDLQGTINNTGTIHSDQQGNSGSTRIRLVSQDLTLTGGGQVTLSSNTLNEIFGNAGNNRLWNVNNKISGAGQIGVGTSMYLINEAAGTITANQTAALTINTGSDIVVNQGTMQDTGTGGLAISSTAVNNVGGVIQAVGANSHVDLASAYLESGTLKTTGGGLIDTTDRGSVLDGNVLGTIANQGTIQIIDNTSLGLVGTINNTGSILLASAGSTTQLKINGQVTTLTGGGKVVMSDNFGNQIFGTGTNTFTNVNNTIMGAGQIGVGTSMYLVNQSLINANGHAALLINTGSDILTNTGTLEATGTAVANGGLVLQTSVNNAGGTIQALGPQAHVDLDGAYIEGGMLKTTGGALIQTVSTGSLDGITSGAVVNTGTVLVNDHTRLDLYGTINNTGTIWEHATSNTGSTTVRIQGQTVTLTGTGQFLMTDNPNNVVFGNNLINQGNTISGAGQFGNGGMDFNNASGQINATGTNPFVINLGNGNGINGATMQANGPGGMVLASGVFTNNGVLAANDGSSVVYQSGAINVNLTEGQLVGGTWKAVANGHGATLDMTGGPLNTDAATIVLFGSGSVIQSGSGSGGTPYTAIEETLNSIDTSGQLQVLGGRSYTTTLDMLDSGQLQLGGGGTLTANSLTIAATGRAFGRGVINDAPVNSGKIEAFGGLLDITGNVTGSGTLQIDNTSTIELGGTSNENVNFALGGTGTFKVDTATDFHGTVTGVALGDVIDLANIAPASITSVSWLNNAPKLIVLHNSTTLAAYSSVTGAGTIAPANAHWVVTSDGSGGSNLTLTSGASTSVITSGGGGGVVTSGGSGDQAWTGLGADNHFNTAGNWNPATVPGVADDAVIDPGVATSVLSTQNNTIDSLTVGAGVTLTSVTGKFSVVDGTDPAGIAATGTIVVGNGASLALGGTITNAGTISDASTGTNSDIIFTQTTNLLTGGGKVILSNSPNNRVYATTAAFVLDNKNNKISGAGQIGNNQMTLINEAAGLINANQSANQLVVNTGANVIVNAGTMEATAGGDLNILSAVSNFGGTILANGAGSIVFLNAPVTGGALITQAGGVIQEASGGVLDGQGLHPVTNGSVIQVGDSQVFTLLGHITNNASFNLNSTGHNTDLRIGSPVVDLTGTGTITLSNNPNNRIFGNQGFFTLNNHTNTIRGAGQLGAAQLTFTNGGLVDANQTNALVLNTSGNLMTNTGTLQASGTGGLLIQNTAVVNTGGTVQALVAGSHVDLSAGSIQGGTLKGFIQTVGGNGGLDGITSGPLTNAGTVEVNDLTQLSLVGVINNTGTIFEHQLSTNGSTQIRIANQTVTLQGGGQFLMSNNGNNLVFGNSDRNTLINVDNTIHGAGQFGDGQMTLINQAGGVIDADQNPNFFQNGQLVVNTSGDLATNAGTMEATAAGGLMIQNTVINNTGGTVLAAGAAAHVDLNSSSIQGGTLVTTGGGVIQTVSGGGNGLDGLTFGQINNTGELLVNDQTQLDLNGVINNTGTIVEDQESAGGSTRIRITGQNVTLTGGGQLQMSDFGANEIFGTNGQNTLTNVDNTISGAGQIGIGTSMFLVNQHAGVINGNQLDQTLTVNTGSDLVTNQGTLEGTNIGGLQISSTAVNNTGGTILATGSNANVYLTSAYIEGGQLKTTGNNILSGIASGFGGSGGVIHADDRGSTLDGITEGTLAIAGVVQVDNTQQLSLVGTINNTGTIGLNASGATGNTDLRMVGDTVTLTGGGKVLMSNDFNNRIFGTGSNNFININNTISGSGQIGVGTSMFFTNRAAGVINANQKTALVVNLGGNLMTNQGTMEATSGTAFNGGLVLQNSTFNNSGGTIQAVGALAHVDLQGAYIEGGLVTGTLIQTAQNTTSTLDGITVGALTNTGTIGINDTSSLQLVGAITNNGTIAQNAFSANSNTDVRIVGATTLSGTGKWILSDNPNNRVFDSGSNYLLVNNGNIISGAGQFGTGGLEFSNTAGQLNATGTNALVIDLGNNNGSNAAQMNATGAGGMVLVNGIFTNTGVMTANDGSAITYQAAVNNTNLTEGTLLLGTWKAVANGHGATFSMTGGTLDTDAATIVLSGAGSVIQAGPGNGATPYTPIEQTLSSIVAGHQLQVLGSRGYTGTVSMDNSGTIQLAGATGVFQVIGALVNEATGLVKGNGTINDGIVNSGKVDANGGTLIVTGDVSGTGSLQVDAGAVLTLNGTSNSAATVLNNATLNVGDSDSLDITGSVTPSSTGVFVLTNASLLEVAADTGANNKVSFLGASGDKLVVDAVASFGTNVGLGTYTGPLLQGFSNTVDKVDLANLTFAGSAIDSYTAGTGLLQLHSGATKATLHFNNADLGAGSFHLNNDGSGHVLVTHS